MRKVFIIILLLLPTTVSANVIIKGYGANQCGQFLDDFSNEVQRNFYISWFNGYLSARNQNSDSTKGQDVNESSFGYAMKNYCEKNPLKYF